MPATSQHSDGRQAGFAQCRRCRGIVLYEIFARESAPGEGVQYTATGLHKDGRRRVRQMRYDKHREKLLGCMLRWPIGELMPRGG